MRRSQRRRTLAVSKLALVPGPALHSATWSSWTWYASEFDPEEGLFFGVVVGLEREFGYFSLEELEGIRGPGGLTIERDLYWTPTPLKECR